MKNKTVILMKNKIVTSLIVSSLLSALTLFFAFRNVPLSQLLDNLATLNYWWLLPTVALTIATFVLRTFRWQLILRDLESVNFAEAFHPLMIGFMMNCVLPGRVGELARPIIFKQKKGLPITTGIATIAAERVFDITFLNILFAFVFSTIANRPDIAIDYFGFHIDSIVLKSAAIGMVRLSVLSLVFIGMLAISPVRRFIKTIITKISGWIMAKLPRAQTKIKRCENLFIALLDNISIGLSMVHSPGRLLACFGLTTLIWALTAYSYFIFAKGCPGINLSIMELTTVMVVICFAIALPSIPGFWGLWEAGGMFALALFGVTGNDALGFILVNHAIQIFPIIIIGLISALITSVNFLLLTNKAGESTGKSHPTTEGV